MSDPRLHEKLGQGCIGMEAMKRIARHPALQELPFILETPNRDMGYIEEIRVVKSWQGFSADIENAAITHENNPTDRYRNQD